MLATPLEHESRDRVMCGGLQWLIHENPCPHVRTVAQSRLKRGCFLTSSNSSSAFPVPIGHEAVSTFHLRIKGALKSGDAKRLRNHNPDTNGHAKSEREEYRKKVNPSLPPWDEG